MTDKILINQKLLPEVSFLPNLANKVAPSYKPDFFIYFTIISKKISLFFIFDLGLLPKIVGVKVKCNSFTSKDVCTVIKRCVLSRITSSFIVFDTNNYSLFNSVLFLKFAKKNKLHLSNTPQRSQENQVVDNIYFRVRLYLHKLLLTKVKHSKKIQGTLSLSNLVDNLSPQLIGKYVHEVVTFYNEKLHDDIFMYKLVPKTIDDTLKNRIKTSPNLNLGNQLTSVSNFSCYKTLNEPLIQNLVYSKKKYNSEALLIPEYRARVINKYADNWGSLFVDLKAEQEAYIHRREAEFEELLLQNAELSAKAADLKVQLSYLVKRETQRELNQAEFLKRRQIRKNANKVPIREAVTAEEFQLILKLTRDTFKESYTKARVTIAIVLLYLTGLRVSNLLLLTRRHLQELVNEGESTIPLIKGGSQNHLICIGSRGKALLQKYQEYVSLLEKYQKDIGGFLFVTQLESSRPISDRRFKGQINLVMKKASIILGKHLRSHSFRATYITDMLEKKIPIEQVKDIVGHAEISTTNRYRRTRLNIKTLRSSIVVLNKTRFVRI